MSTISNVSFSVEPKNEKNYQVQLSFKNKENQDISNKIFSCYQKSEMEKGFTLDVYSQNGTCKLDTPLGTLKHIFRKNDELAITHALRKNTDLDNQSIFVLDLQDPHTHYLDCMQCPNSIAKCEQVVDSYFQNKSEKNNSSIVGKIHNLFQENQVKFVLHEGSLKSDILKTGFFSDPEIQFFQDTPLGRERFCQCAEFFMNAFKFGQEITLIDTCFEASKYIVPLFDRNSAFRPKVKSTVLYPATYQNVYSSNGAYTEAIASAFSIFCEFDPNSKITTMNLELKKTNDV